MSARINVAELRARVERLHDTSMGADMRQVRRETLLALLDTLEAARTVAPFLPPLHRESLGPYLARFDFEAAA